MVLRGYKHCEVVKERRRKGKRGGLPKLWEDWFTLVQDERRRLCLDRVLQANLWHDVQVKAFRLADGSWRDELDLGYVACAEEAVLVVASLDAVLHEERVRVIVSCVSEVTHRVVVCVVFGDVF